MMTLSPEQKKKFRAMAQHLSPVTTVGQKGITQGVLRQIADDLINHELIKIKIKADDRLVRAGMLQEILGATGCELVQTIGQVAVLYREGESQKINSNQLH
tara:strand:- start:391 stop:693 length:303 start_codon:yes stop_codon:yes gene_type:complete